ncbi:MAG: lipid A deacylase LpxR family protein [Gemmatimonadaceae bacterium]
MRGGRLRESDWMCAACRLASAALVVAAMAAGGAAAQDVEVQRSRVTALDNDYFVFTRPPNRRSDHNYTHGAALELTLPTARNAVTRVPCDRRSACAVALSLGQQMYTPTKEDTVPVAGQRPHAGWLSARAELRAIRTDRALALGVVVGTTGPNARADDLQAWIHRKDRFLRQPLGWDHQLPNELFYAATVRLEELRSVGERPRWSVDAMPHVSAALGTLRASAAASVTVRAGWGLRHPWVREPMTNGGIYLIARLGGEAVGHSLFLDGNGRRDFASVKRLSPVMELERGFGMRMLKLLVEYTVTARSREYLGGPEVHRVGRINATWLH